MERPGEGGADDATASVTLRRGGTYWLGVAVAGLGLALLAFFSLLFMHPVVSPVPAASLRFEDEAYVLTGAMALVGAAVAVPAHGIRELHVDGSGIRLVMRGRPRRDIPWGQLSHLETGYRWASQPGNPGLTWVLVAKGRPPARTIRLSGKAVRADLNDIKAAMRLAADSAHQRGIPVREFSLEEWRAKRERQLGRR